MLETPIEHTPLVSVLMTAYNREKYIAEAIESVLASTYTNFELIISDDRSQDGTVGIAKAYEEKDKRIKVFTNQSNLQQFQNRNLSLTYAKGEYIFFVDSDDTITPGAIEKLVQSMQRFPAAQFAMYCDKPVEEEPFLLDGKKAIRDHFFSAPLLIIGPGGTFSKAGFIKNIGGYPVSYGAAGDLYFNLKACCHSDIIMLPFKFLNYRVHGAQELNNPFAYIYNNYLYLKDALAELPLGLSAKERSWLQKKNARRFVVNVSRFFRKTFDFRRTFRLLKLGRFTFADLGRAVFN